MDSPSNSWECYEPCIDRYWLLLVAGLVWSLVGLTLCEIASYWLSLLDWPRNMLYALAGFVTGIFAYRFAFSGIARKNIRRINRLPRQVWLFAFQSWRSYLLIAFMVTLGYSLRHSQLSRHILAFIYLAIGTALTLASSCYYEQL